MFLGKAQDGRHPRPWNKNRHTKPCKYYQTMSCPLSADVCDFAHVLVHPTPPIRTDATACRYYQAGFCANGAWCRYAHLLEASPAVSNAMNGMRISSLDGQRRASPGNAGPQPYVRTDRGVISMHVPPVGPDPGPPPASSNLQVISPSPSNSFPGLRHHSAGMTSPSFPDLFDEVYASTADPQMSEHSHSHQSRIHIADPSPLVHIPPYPNHLPIGPISPQYQFTPPLYMFEPKFFRSPPPPKKRNTRGISKKKLERYKTKPCKFFCGAGMCPNGDSCTFIHGEDPQSINRIPKNREEIDDGRSDSSDISSESAKSSSASSNRVPDQNFCQVGAMITRNETFLHDGSSTDNSSSESGDSALKKTKHRTRANSIPSRPTASGQLSVDTLFSAESPAVL